jgi:segregation and condensation protein A
MISNEDQLRFKMDELSFEGPLDRLLAIVNKNKMSIYDIRISLLFEQYMEYIKRMQDMNMDIAGEFLDMASRLMLIKSRMILPRESDDPKDDPRREIVDALLEYQKAKENAGKLLPLYQRYSGRMTKETDEVGVDKTFVADQDCMVLMAAFERIMMRQRLASQAITQEPQKTLNTIVISMSIILFGLKNYLHKKSLE